MELSKNKQTNFRIYNISVMNAGITNLIKLVPSHFFYIWSDLRPVKLQKHYLPALKFSAL